MTEIFEVKNKSFARQKKSMRFFGLSNGDVYFSGDYLSQSDILQLMIFACEFIRIDGIKPLYWRAKDMSEVSKNDVYIRTEAHILENMVIEND